MIDRLLSGLRVLAPVSIVAIVGAIGCTTSATVTTDDDPCVLDSSVSCPGGGDGYSCGADVPPDASLNCSDRVVNGDEDDYCCVGGTTVTVVTPAGCTADPTLSCITGSSGFTCPAGTTPTAGGDECSDPTADGANDDFCCFDFTSSTCSQDDTVQGCVAGSYGFSCTGTDTPDSADSSLNCSTGTADGSDTLYCCTL